MQPEPQTPPQVFSYVARDVTGSKQKGNITAQNHDDAFKKLQEQGLFPIDITASTASRPTRKIGTRKASADAGPAKLSLRQKADFISRLAKLTGSQINLDRSLSILAESSRDPIKQVATDLRMHIREGSPVREGFERIAGLDDPACLALIQSADVSGNLPQAFAVSARLLERRLAVFQKVTSSLIYPSLLLLLAFFSVTLILVVIIPQFRPLVEDKLDTVPVLGQIVFTISAFFVDSGTYILSALLIFAIFLLIGLRRGWFEGSLWGALKRLPFAYKVVRHSQIALGMHILGAMLSRGVVLNDALRICGQSVSEPKFKADITAVADQVRSGSALSLALAQNELLPTDGVEMIRIGEETGSLADMIVSYAHEMQEATDRNIERFLTLFQPILIVFVGLVVGVSLYALFSAIVSVNTLSL